jgi:hypothetical protein
MYVPHVQHAERSAHARWHVDVAYIKGKLALQSAIKGKLALQSAVPISHIASKARELRGMLTHSPQIDHRSPPYHQCGSLHVAWLCLSLFLICRCSSA